MFRLISRIALLIVVISVFWLGTKPEWVSVLSADPPEDKFIHAAVFGFITVLLWFSTLKPHPVMVFMVSLTISAADECRQYYLPGRTASFEDLAADIMGIALIITLLIYTQRKPASSS
jgi:VanZ family protein